MQKYTFGAEPGVKKDDGGEIVLIVGAALFVGVLALAGSLFKAPSAKDAYTAAALRR